MGQLKVSTSAREALLRREAEGVRKLFVGMPKGERCEVLLRSGAKLAWTVGEAGGVIAGYAFDGRDTAPYMRYVR